jgi:hypothetical protein
VAKCGSKKEISFLPQSVSKPFQSDPHIVAKIVLTRFFTTFSITSDRMDQEVWRENCDIEKTFCVWKTIVANFCRKQIMLSHRCKGYNPQSCGADKVPELRVFVRTILFELFLSDLFRTNYFVQKIAQTILSKKFLPKLFCPNDFCPNDYCPNNISPNIFCLNYICPNYIYPNNICPKDLCANDFCPAYNGGLFQNDFDLVRPLTG